MNLRDEFEKLSHAEKVQLFIGAVIIVSFTLGAVTGIFWRELLRVMA